MTEIVANQKALQEFQNTVWEFYKKSGRHALPWRLPGSTGLIDPYHVLVSEIMLQQTQVNRVIPKFEQFLKLFPTVDALSSADLAEVLIAWSGLGYNRRAKFLHQSAQMIVDQFAGQLPRTLEDLVKLPGVGINTAAAVAAYSFNEPVVFIETNIRAIYLHHFFKYQDNVSDEQIKPLLEATLDPADSRQWYWALMDYGSYLKSTLPNPSRRSKHYVLQSAFEGSRRQLRGRLLRTLGKQPSSLAKLMQEIDDERLAEVLLDLVSEGLASRSGTMYSLGR